MIRRAFRMRINPGAAEEYEYRHRPIWRELEDALIDHGVLTYSIYLDDETYDLFGYVEIESEERWA
ncbi:MAG TPA: L-rhamnose mutarotase, partial [Vicinamibacterales bacterium]|nr:L-rhamnose mutarotase [Vicinamibacterales bacterium]